MKQKWINMYLDIAERLAEESHAKRLKVGALFVSSEGVMSSGINGLPAGGSNECEDILYLTETEVAEYLEKHPEEKVYEDELGKYVLVSKPEVGHAEEHLFGKMMRQGVSAKGGTIFVTHAPCLECSKQIVVSGIKKVYYIHEYRCDKGPEWLRKNGVEVVQVKR